jgi:hypothetical protein
VERLCALLLIAALSMSPVMPLLYAESEAQLPACCRKDGKHGCATSKAKTPVLSTDVAMRSKVIACSQFSMGKSTCFGGKCVPVIQFESLGAPQVTIAATIAEMEARWRISLTRSSQKRGPPYSLQA